MPEPVTTESGAASDVKEPLRLEGRPLLSSEDVARYFGVPHGRMIWTLYRAPDTVRYRHFEIPKRSGGMRPIHAPTGLVRELQDKLLVDLTALYRPHPHAHGFIGGRSVTTNAAFHTGRRWVLNIDLEDFFPTINFGRVRGLFLKAPFEMGPAAAAVCAQIATYRNGLPQGAPTSPVISNLIAATLDRRLLRLARQHKVEYSRYADDITFSTAQHTFPPSIALREPIDGGGYAITAGEGLALAIAQSGFSINMRKVRLQGHGVHQSVTGLTVNARVNVARERIRRLRAMLHAWRKFGLDAAAAEHFAKYRGADPAARAHAPARAFRNVVYGHLAFVGMVRGKDDPVFLKLCAKVLEADPDPSRFIRQMVFGADDYEVFISHASEDKETIARPIWAACAKAGIKAFLDDAHIGFGQSFAMKINTALGASRTVLAIVSSTSVTKEWPLIEVNTALALEATGKKRVIPVMVGEPDLTKLPLIRSKRWITWGGDAGKVVAEMKRHMQPASDAGGGAKPSPKTAPAENSAPSATSPWARVPDAPLSPIASKPVAADQRSWLSRLFRK